MCRRVQDDGQHQVGGRPGGDDERALPERLAVEGAAELADGNGALPLGILSAVYKGSFVDTVARTIALLGQSVPSFWLAIILILVFGVALAWFPVAGRTGLSSYVLPSRCPGFAQGEITQMTQMLHLRGANP